MRQSIFHLQPVGRKLAAGLVLLSSMLLASCGGDDDTAVVIPNPPAFLLSSSAFTVQEGQTLSVTVLRTSASGSATVDFATSDGSAAAGSDYTATSGTLTFPDGVLAQTFTVPITVDGNADDGETFSITLSNPSAGTTLANPSSAQVTIQSLSAGGPGVLEFNPTTVTGTEGSTVNLTVVRSGGTTGTISVNYAATGGTATSGSDFPNTFGTLTFPDGVSSQTIGLALTSDGTEEFPETIQIALANPTNGATLGANNVATVHVNQSATVQTRAIGLGPGNTLVRFALATPGTTTTTTVNGLQSGESLLAIDFRPADGRLYGVTNQNRLYRIDPITGGSTLIGAPGAFTLNGTAFGFDFNPVVDRIRVVSNTEQNLRLNPNDGTLTASDSPLNPGNPNVVAAAYTNSFVGAASTTLYVLDSVTDSLLIQNPPNAGTLTTIGALGVDTNEVVGFDIESPTNGTAYAVLTVGGVSGLYTINLTTGAATLVGAVGSGATPINGLAIQPAGSP